MGFRSAGGLQPLIAAGSRAYKFGFVSQNRIKKPSGFMLLFLLTDK
jgi:hypothetical protein